MKSALTVTVILWSMLTATCSFAESWTEFHTETWSFYSEKLHKKLNFKSSYYYDAASVRRSKNGDMTAWVKEISDNDRFYVGKGNPEKETSFRQIKLWCSSKKYAVVTGDGDFELDESLGEAVNPGTQYAMLYDRLCSK